MIVVQGDCDREVEVGMPTSISATVAWGDRLSGLRVTARLTGPEGSTHTVVLSDEGNEEPNGGDYCGAFTPQVPGRYVGEIRFASKGRVQHAGGIHRAVHALQEDREPARFDLRSKAPVFIRRIPIYFDAGMRPVPKDLDKRHRSRGTRTPPVRKRKKGLKPLDLGKALQLVNNAEAKKKKAR